MDLLYTPTLNSSDEMAKQLGSILKRLEEAAVAGRWASGGLEQVMFISAGAGLAIGESLKAYSDGVAKKFHCSSYASAKFVNMLTANPSIADDPHTLIILSSKSGKTRETVGAAKLLKDKHCKTFVFTKSEDTPLGSVGHRTFLTGEVTQAFHATHMLMASFIGGILEMTANWSFVPALLSSLRVLPTALCKAAEDGVLPGEGFAADFNEKDPLYFISSGSGVLVPRAYGLCVLQERFGFDVHVVEASDFFHSFVETVRPGTQARFILIIPEDRSRGEMLDVKTFFEKAANNGPVNFHVVDTKDLDTSDIDPEILKIVGPLLCEAFLKAWTMALAKATKKTLNDPLLHMGRFEYYNCHAV